jgi:hypothetical protein
LYTCVVPLRWGRPNQRARPLCRATGLRRRFAVQDQDLLSSTVAELNINERRPR